jgi:hypothetical protein
MHALLQGGDLLLQGFNAGLLLGVGPLQLGPVGLLGAQAVAEALQPLEGAGEAPFQVGDPGLGLG